MERVAKCRVSNRSDSKKSDSGTQKVGYFVGLCALFTPNFMFCFIRSGSGRVGYIPNLAKSGSGSPKKVRVGYPKIWVPAPPLEESGEHFKTFHQKLDN